MPTVNKTTGIVSFSGKDPSLSVLMPSASYSVPVTLSESLPPASPKMRIVHPKQGAPNHCVRIFRRVRDDREIESPPVPGGDMSRLSREHSLKSKSSEDSQKRDGAREGGKSLQPCGGYRGDPPQKR